MKVGSLVFSTQQGLGILAKSFYDHKIVTDVLTVSHGRRDSHPEWYPDSDNLHSLNTSDSWERAVTFCRKMDVMLFFETPFIWELIPYCKKHGVKTVIMVMYECMPKELPYEPDLFLCPSLLDLQYYPQKSVYLPVPVEVEWKQRDKAHTFVHNAGHGGLKGRNGTNEVLRSLRYITKPVNIIIRSQVEIPGAEQIIRASNMKGTLKSLDYIVGTVPQQELYSEGDVFLFPEKFNGLSLPLQEALASGMLVMATDRFPMNTWLPNAPLIPVVGSLRTQVSPRCNVFDEAVIEPEDIAKKIDQWYDTDLTEYTKAAKGWAHAMSWDMWGHHYLEILGRLVS